MNKFKKIITSPPDREKLVLEIWFQDSQVAEINQEGERLEIEFYPQENMKFDFDEFLACIETAKKDLLNS